jgi:hypothetical protein
VRLIVGIALISCLLGCGSPAEPAAPPDEIETPVLTPDNSEAASSETDESNPTGSAAEKLLEVMRSGNTQILGAMSTLQEASTQAMELGSSLPVQYEVMDEIIDLINSSGQSLAEGVGDVPTLEEIEQSYAAADDRRLKWIEAASDGYIDIRSAYNFADSMSEEDPQFDALAGLLDLASQDMADAVDALGGSVD